MLTVNPSKFNLAAFDIDQTRSPTCARRQATSSHTGVTFDLSQGRALEDPVRLILFKSILGKAALTGPSSFLGTCYGSDLGRLVFLGPRFCSDEPKQEGSNVNSQADKTLVTDDSYFTILAQAD